MKKRGKFRIHKANGQFETYSRSKLFNSLRRSGLSIREASLITDKVSREVTEGSKTKDIYKKTLNLVKQSSPVAAAQYSLKRSIFDLGPAGHHFEEFVARFFQEQGFTTQTCVILPGKWVNHEIDVVVEKPGKKYFVECKFHNRKGIKNDIKLALYVKARWDDLREGPEGVGLSGFFLASNTAFTMDAITYSNGNELKLLGVNAPLEESFLEKIKKLRLYPITSLRKLNKHQKHTLISQDILLAKDVADNLELLVKLGLSEEEIHSVLDEIELLKDRNI